MTPKKGAYIIPILLVSALAGVAALAASAYADESLPDTCPGLSQSECNDLKSQYTELQKEIAGLNSQIAETQAKKGTLQGDVSALNAQIAQAEAQIKAKNIEIKKIGGQIETKTATINQLSAKIDDGHASLASFLRQQDQADDLSLVEIAFAADNAFSLFNDVDNIVTVQAGLNDQFAEIRDARSAEEEARKDLADQQAAANDAKYVVQNKEQEIDKNKQEKTQLLAITANQEAQYQQVLAQRQAQAAQIRARLFPLRDAAAISFGDAVNYAKTAQAKTGVDPALALAILTQESNLGANVGQCYMTDDATGNGKGKNTGTPFTGVMNPTRDVPPFLALAKQLGFDPHTQVVSCPIASVGGWGGAMGPSQFIPSTWALLAPRITSTFGVAPNPWDPEAAIMAMSLYLSDLGAGAGGYTAEYNAAARYYAGWDGPNTSAGKSYAGQVMARVTSFTADIKVLADN
jgi:peptidoglycan hydrolase CwlO-like protein